MTIDQRSAAQMHLKTDTSSQPKSAQNNHEMVYCAIIPSSG